MSAAASALLRWFEQLDLLDCVHGPGGVVVALSGGVDSSVVAAAAARSSRPALAITAHSPAVATWQRTLAARVADEIGIEHRIVKTDESQRDDYRRNDRNRCYYCKQTLYQFLHPIARERGAVIVSGTNADDLGDFRPGIQAGREADVRCPLAELNLSKADVREIAAAWSLSNADLPASPCLSSRIAYGISVTPERLQMIDLAEEFLRERGFLEMRVRLHQDDLARIEVPRTDLARALGLSLDEDWSAVFRRFGFRYVTVDLAGLRSGNLNETLVNLQPASQRSNSQTLPASHPHRPTSTLHG